MKKSAFKQSERSVAARAKLIAMSSEAQVSIQVLAASTGEVITVNQMLLKMHAQESGAKQFFRFNEWKEKGYSVKKGEQSFRIWGSPIKAGKTTDDQAAENDAEKKYKFWPMCCVFNEFQVEAIEGAVVLALDAELPALCIGEKVETVYRNRSTGNYGEYLGQYHNSHMVRVDGVTFEILSNPETDSAGYWTVINHNTGKTSRSPDRLALIETVREANTGTNEVIKKVLVSEFRDAIQALERTYHTDRHACVDTAEKLGNMRNLFFWLRNMEALTCARAKPDDIVRRDGIISAVRAYLGLAGNNPEPVPPTPTKTSKEVRKTPAGDAVKAAKLRSLADKQTVKIEQFFAERLQNTAKRLAQAASARLDGERLKRAQAALFSLADLVEQGSVPAELQQANSLKSMLELVRGKSETVPNGFHSYQIDSGQPHNETPAVLAAWALLKPKTQAEKNADVLRVKEASLLNADIPGFFPSPKSVVNLIIDRAQLKEGLSVVDTSAGTGAILDGVKERFGITGAAYEKNYSLNEILNLKEYCSVQGDSLEYVPGTKFDRVLINPPFEHQQDIDHIKHGFEHFLKSGGRLVAVCWPGIFTSSTRKAADFRDWLSALGGEVEKLPAESFRESGTNVDTMLICIDKPMMH